MNEIKNHGELTDSEFESQFENGTLDPILFSHEAHLRLAWIHITKYGLQKAQNKIPIQIKKYVASLGAQDKYNETVTLAGIKAVNHFILCSKSNDFLDFITKNKKLLTNFKGLLMSHYKTNIFESLEAKNNFMEPELMPFD